MRRFRFRLQVVLDRALKEEEEQQLELARVRKELAEKAREIQDMIQLRHNVRELTDRAQEGVFDPRQIQECYLRLEAITVDLAHLRSEYKAIGQRVEAQQQVVVQAMRKRQTLEKLYTKQREEFRLQLERREAREIDDALLPRLAREKQAERIRIQRLQDAGAIQQ